MSTLRTIRKRLQLTQSELAGHLGVSQGNVSFYENGATIPPHVARRLVMFARSRGDALTFDDVYGDPVDVEPAVTAQAAA